jgi:hypothetical protein
VLTKVAPGGPLPYRRFDFSADSAYFTISAAFTFVRGYLF